VLPHHFRVGSHFFCLHSSCVRRALDSSEY
jgi:hypothetical protein